MKKMETQKIDHDYFLDKPVDEDPLEDFLVAQKEDQEDRQARSLSGRGKKLQKNSFVVKSRGLNMGNEAAQNKQGSKKSRRSSFERTSQSMNQIDFLMKKEKKKKVNTKAYQLKLEKGLAILLNYESKPEKRILSKKEKKVLWRILLHKEKLTDEQYGKFWLLASGAANFIGMEHNRGYYYILRDKNMEYPNPCFNQIEVDLRRTFPNDPPEVIEQLIVPMRNVLFTFVKRNPTIGYCQGMNFIVGNLLKYLNEEETFWTFVCICENMLPLDYYSELLGILVDQKVFEHMMIEKFPKLVSHM